MRTVPVRGLWSITDIQRACEVAQRAIGHTPGAALQLPDEAADKLRWLQRQGRDVRAVTPELTRAMSEAFASAFSRAWSGSAPWSTPWVAAVTAYRDHLSRRLLTGGDDVRSALRPLLAATTKRKGHGRVGYDTGSLQREVASATVIPTRGA